MTTEEVVQPKRRGRIPKQKEQVSVDPESNSSPKVWASVGATINTGDYENKKIDIGVSGVPVGATPEEIKELIKMSSNTLDEVLSSLSEKMIEIMEAFGR